MNKKQTFGDIKKQTKNIIKTADAIVAGKKLAKQHKDTLTVVERDFYYKDMKKREKELVNFLRLFNEGIEAVITELKETYDYLTILPPEYDEFLKKNEEEYQENVKKQAEISKRGVKSRTIYTQDGDKIDK